MRRRFFELSLIFIISILVEQEYHAFASKDVYVSRHYGNDSRICGSESTPCRTLARGIDIADRYDRILLDGLWTKSDPYNCRADKPERNGTTTRLKDKTHTAVNFSLQIAALHTPAHISCDHFLNFIGASSSNDKMTVFFSSIVFSNTSMDFIDATVSFVNCSFLESVNPIKIALVLQQSATVVVKALVFFNNTGSIRVELSKSNTQITIDLDNVNFQRNRPLFEHEGSGISFYSPLRTKASKVNVTVSCKNTVFSHNIGPLITNNAAFSESSELYQNVKFLKNYAAYDGLNATRGKSLYFSKGRSTVVVFDSLVSAENTNFRCVEFSSNAVQLKVFNSYVSGHVVESAQSGAGVLVTAVQSVNVLIRGSSFNENTASRDGGAVAFYTVGGSIELKVLKSNFTKTSAAQDGGAFSIKSQHGSVAIHLENVLFQGCRSKNTGGALSVIVNRKTYFTARYSTWVSSTACLGSAVYIQSSSNEGQSNTTAKVETCKFIDNVALFGNFMVASSFGSIDVSQTEWSRNSQGFYMECDCLVNFTDVSVTRCSGPAFMILGENGSSQKNKAIMKLHLERCSFEENKGDDIGVLSQNTYLQLSLKSIRFYDKKIIKGQGCHALKVVVGQNATLGSKIMLRSVHIENFVGAASITLQFKNNGANNTVIITNSTFHQIRSYFSERYHTEASPLSIVMPHDGLNHNMCSRSHLSFQYRNTIIIENTSFVGNIGRMSGGVYLNNGNVTMRNCTFDNNFAIQSGGHIHITDGSATVRIDSCHFKQSLVEKIFANEIYIHDTSIYSESTASLLLQKTLVTTDLEKGSYRLFSVTKAGVVKFDNLTRLQCAVGSALRLDNFSHFIIWPFSNPPCKLKMTVITLSCHQCSPGLYSLKRGEVTAFQNRGDSLFHPFKCIPCPDGANCSRNIFAKPNYWGYPDSNNHGKLTFVHCPSHYCTPTEQQSKNLSVYNSCYGNRDGVMCGRCKEGYTETLFCKTCKQNEKCRDRWIWFLMFIYVVVMALFLIHQPPIVQILVKNTLWFRKAHPNRMEYQPLDQRNEYDSGYTMIVFYFYQIASYLRMESLAVAAKKTPYVSLFVGLFNFQTRVSQGGLGCPFPGLTVVTKELLPALLVMATLFSIQVMLLLHWLFNKWTRRPRPTKARYYGATLKTLLLGYATLANTSLKLLTCVPVMGESRLYFDGNITCLTWWQNLLIIFIVAFLLPFVVVIYWGAMKLRRKLISVEQFIAACFFPLGFIFFWISQKLVHRRRQGQVASESRQMMLKVLHDPFRPPSPRQSGSLYWESVLIGRRFLLLSYQVFFPDPLLRMFCMDMTCLLVFTWHVVTKPFRDWKANIIEAVSLAALVVIATINLVKAIFTSDGMTPQGSMKRNLNILQQIEIFLLASFPLLLASLCTFAIISQVARLFVLIYRSSAYAFRSVFRCVLTRRIRVLGQYESIN